MKYINAHVPHHLALLLPFLILLPVWTHEGRKSEEACLKEEKKQESPMGIPHEEKEKERKETRKLEGGAWGGFNMEADLDSERNTRRGGMNVNILLHWKVVTMDIPARRGKLHSRPRLICVHTFMPPRIPARRKRIVHPATSAHSRSGLRSRLRGCVVVSHSNYPDDCGCLTMICVVYLSEAPGRARALYSL